VGQHIKLALRRDRSAAGVSELKRLRELIAIAIPVAN
jgi:hypothetical protein